MTESTIIKHCITCGKDGHTYIECPTVDFFSLFSCVLGVEPIFGQSSKDVVEGIKEINKNGSDE